MPVVPPMVLKLAPRVIRTPSSLPRAAVPAALVPMKLPYTALWGKCKHLEVTPAQALGGQFHWSSMARNLHLRSLP